MGENGIVSGSCDGAHTSLQDPNLIELAVENGTQLSFKRWSKRFQGLQGLGDLPSDGIRSLVPRRHRYRPHQERLARYRIPID